MSIHAVAVRETSARNGKGPVPSTSPAPVMGLFEMMGAPLTFARNEEVYGEGEPAEYLYTVQSGCVRTSKILNDGRRQIGAFYLPGDVFGLEAGDAHSFSAEALAPTTVRIVKRTAMTSRAACDSAMASHLLQVTTKELQRTQNRILLLIKSAQERVAGFLLEMANRVQRNRAADVAPGYRRLSRPHHRNRIADADPA